MKIIWTPAALRSLKTIRHYISEESPRAAKRVADVIERSVLHLAMFPYSGRRGIRKNTRELVITGFPYIVIYRISDKVEILYVFHTKQQRR